MATKKTVTVKQIGSPAQHARRVTAQPDVSVRQQHGLPAAHAGERIEDIAAQRRSTAAPGKFDGGGGLVDAERRHAAPNQIGHQPARSAPEVDGRPVA